MRLHSLLFLAWSMFASVPVAIADSAPAQSLCKAEEGVVFSCPLGSKVVSVCTEPKTAPFSAITYRYGRTQHLELSYVSSTKNQNHFSAYAMPANPNAIVEQLWFDRGNTRYVVTACTGGNCPVAAGLLVYQGDRVLAHHACDTTEMGQPWFSRKVLKFGPTIEQSRSFTDLIRIEEEANDLEPLYPSRPWN